MMIHTLVAMNTDDDVDVALANDWAIILLETEMVDCENASARELRGPSFSLLSKPEAKDQVLALLNRAVVFPRVVKQMLELRSRYETWGEALGKQKSVESQDAESMSREPRLVTHNHLVAAIRSGNVVDLVQTKDRMGWLMTFKGVDHNGDPLHVYVQTFIATGLPMAIVDFSIPPLSEEWA